MIDTLSLSDFQEDSLHEYGGGDCWGNISSYSNDSDKIILVEFTCSEYNATKEKYVFHFNDSLQVYHKIKSNLFFTETSNYYEFLELVIDFRKIPAIKYIRTDTVQQVHDYSAKKTFVTSKLVDTDSVYKALIEEQRDTWKAEYLDVEDY